MSGEPVVSAPLTALGSAYRYGPGGTLPTSSFTGENYWVDVKFDTSAPPEDTAAPVVLSTLPPSDASGVDPTAKISILFNEGLQPGAAITLKDSQGSDITGTTEWESNRSALTFTPESQLPLGETLTASASGACPSSWNIRLATR